MFKQINHWFVFAHRKQITSWKAILVSCFVAGFASALILAVSQSWLSKIFAAPTVITNQAQVTYKDTSGKSYFGQSNQVLTTITQIVAAKISVQVALEGKNVDTATNLTVYLYQAGATANPVLQATKVLSTGALDIDAISLANGTYDLKVVAPYHLSTWLKNISFSGSDLDLKNSVLKPKAGNLQDADDIINSLDWQIMNSKWATNDTVADINKDGAVNTLDWGIMNKNWLATGS